MNCKIESHFLNYVQHGGPHLDLWRAACGPRAENHCCKSTKKKFGHNEDALFGPLSPLFPNFN